MRASSTPTGEATFFGSVARQGRRWDHPVCFGGVGRREQRVRAFGPGAGNNQRRAATMATKPTRKV